MQSTNIKKKLMKQIYITTFLLLFSLSSVLCAQGRVLRASLSTSVTNSSQITQGNYKVQQSIGHAGVIGARKHSNITAFRGFLLPGARTESQQELDLEWSVYPVPFDTHVNIKFDSPVSGEMTLRLYNILGQLVHEKQQHAKQHQQVPLENVSNGKYLLTIDVMGKQLSKQLLQYTKPYKL